MSRILFATLIIALRMAAGPLSPFLSTGTQITATAVDSSNNIYIAGNVTASAVSTIPTTPGAYLQSEPGCATGSTCSRGFVAKFSSSSALIFATYIGVVDNGDTVSAIALDSAGNIFVAGQRMPIATIPGGNFPPAGYIDKLAADGSKLLGSYSIGGGTPSAIAVSASGDVFAAGQTVSQATPCGCQFTTTPGAFQSASLGGTDAFVIHLDATLSHLLYATVVGGGGNDGASGITVDGAGETYITGSTNDSSSFPVAPLGYMQTTLAPNLPRVFVAKLNASGSGLIFSALFDPANGNSTGLAIAVDGSGVYVAGMTNSTFAPLHNAFMTTGTQFVAKLTPDGSSLLSQTLLPGPASALPPPPLFKIAIDAAGNVLVMGHSDTPVPAAPDSFAPCTAALGATDYFVLQLNSTFSASTYGSYLPGGLAIRADGRAWYSDSSGALNSFNINDPLPPGVRCVADAFTGLSGPVAPGKLVTLMGPGIGPDAPATQQIDSTGKVAVGLSGVNVYFNGIAAPLLSVSSTQIEAVVPFENLDPVEFPTSTVVILKNGAEIDGPPVPVVAIAPVLLTDSLGCISGFNSDGTLNSSANPAALGSLIAIFGEGAGLMNPAITGGIGTGQSQIVAPVKAFLVDPTTSIFGADGGGPIPSQPAATLYAGDTPGFVEGIFQINLLLPGSFRTGQDRLSVNIGNSILTPCVWVKAAN